MGVLVSTSVHYRASNSAGSCHGLFITDDNPPDYTTVSGVQIDQGVVSGLEPTIRDDITHDSVDETGMATGEAGTWHYPGECPDR